MEIQGKIIHILEPKTGTSAKGDWVVQEFVLEIPGQYTRKMVFSVFGSENLQKFNIQMGGTYVVKFDVDAREYNGRWFTSIRAWNVFTPVTNGLQTAVDAPMVEVPGIGDMPGGMPPMMESDLPF